MLKTLLADTDYLVGYDADGKYIRISKTDLAQSVAGAAAASVPTVAIQYSIDGSSWHDTYSPTDKYFRLKVGSTGGAALKVGMSAYDVWKAQGNSGSEADFLASLKGEPGEGADLSSLQLQNIEGYAELLRQVNDTVQNAKSAIVEEATNEAVANVMDQLAEQMETLATKEYVDDVETRATEAARTAAQEVLDSKLDKDLSNIDTTSTIADGSYIPVVTDGDVKKVKMETVSAYTELKSTTSRQSSTGQGESSQPSESGGTVPQSTSGVFDVTVTPDLWEENDIWQYVAIVHDDNAARLQSAFASPASETLQEWSDCPISLVSIEDGVLVFASPKALPAESITMKVYYKR